MFLSSHARGGGISADVRFCDKADIVRVAGSSANRALLQNHRLSFLISIKSSL